MNKTTINGIDCYGVAELGANYAITFDDEYKDFIATDIEATNWQQVIKALDQPRFAGIVQIEAV
jgi:hypothetical protein